MEAGSTKAVDDFFICEVIGFAFVHPAFGIHIDVGAEDAVSEAYNLVHQDLSERIAHGDDDFSAGLEAAAGLGQFGVSFRHGDVIYVCDKGDSIKCVIGERQVSHIPDNIIIFQTIVLVYIDACSIAVKEALYEAIVIAAADVQAATIDLAGYKVKTLGGKRGKSPFIPVVQCEGTEREREEIEDSLSSASSHSSILCLRGKGLFQGGVCLAFFAVWFDRVLHRYFT